MRQKMTLADTNKYNEMYEKAMFTKNPINELSQLRGLINLTYSDRCKEARLFIAGITDAIGELKEERRRKVVQS